MALPLDPVVRHRREVWLQIVMPIVLAAAVIILGLVALFVATVSHVIEPGIAATYAEISVILFCLLPLLIIGLIFDAIIIFIVWKLGSRLSSVIIPSLRGVRGRVQAFAGWLPKQSQRVARPLIALNTVATRLEHIIRGLLRFGHPSDKDSSQT